MSKVTKATRKNGASKSERQAKALEMAAKMADPKPAAGAESKSKDAGKKGKKNKDSKAGKKVPKGAGKVKAWANNGIPIETKVSTREDGSFASVKLFGHSLTSVLRAAGKADYTPAQMRVVFDQLGLQAVRINQIRDKISRCDAGEAAPLGKKDFAKFDALIKAGTKGKEDIE